MHAPGVIIPNDISRISVAVTHRSPGSTSAQKLEPLCFLSAFLRSVANFSYWRSFTHLSLSETASEDTFEHQLPEFVHTRGIVEIVSQQTWWRFGQASSVLDLVITRAPDDIGVLSWNNRQAEATRLHFARGWLCVYWQLPTNTAGTAPERKKVNC